MMPSKPSSAKPPSFEHLAAQLRSPNVKDRLLAMVELQRETTPAQDAYPLIQQALSDEAVQVRGMAVFSLGIKPTAASLPQLVSILQSDDDYNIRAMAAGALGYLGNPQALDTLRHAFLEDTDWLVQFSAAVSLGNLKDEQAADVLLEALQSDRPILQEAAIMALGEIGAIAHVERILAFVAAQDWMMRKRVADALGNMPCSQSQSALKYLRSDSNPQVAAAAVRALERLQVDE